MIFQLNFLKQAVWSLSWWIVLSYFSLHAPHSLTQIFEWIQPQDGWQFKVFNWQSYLKVHHLYCAFCSTQMSTISNNLLNCLGSDLIFAKRSLLCIKHREYCLFSYAGAVPCRLCIVECSSRRPCLASLVLLVVNTEAPAPVPEHRHFSPPLPARRPLLSSVVGSETEPNWSLSHFFRE